METIQDTRLPKAKLIWVQWQGWWFGQLRDALHMERREVELCHQLVTVRETLEHECIDGDALLRLLDMDPEQYRTEAGRLNLLKIRAELADRKTHNT